MTTHYKWLEDQGYFKIMEYRRSHESSAEQAFIKDILEPELKQHGIFDVDDAGNYIIRIGKKYDTLFSCHIDTMHNKILHTDAKQKLVIDSVKGHLYSGGHECLGADDGSGIFLLFMLLRNKVPGLYIFHRGEERGGIGSSYIAKTASDTKIFKKINKAVAFDRYKTNHVITHQGGRRCASDEFAKALAAEFQIICTTDWQPNDGGTFTDTANYTSLIPECTNISVGYMHQHTAQEYQDLDFLNMFAQGIHEVAWDNLPVERDPKIVELPIWVNRLGNTRRVANKKAVPFRPERNDVWDDYFSDEITAKWVVKNASDVADFLNLSGYSIDSIEEDLDELSIDQLNLR
jgi:hypothetical protein